MTTTPLPPDLAAVLRFETRHAHLAPAPLADAVRQAFGLSVTRYRARLVRAVRHPGAEAVEPVTVHRLRRVLDAERARRQRWATPQPQTPQEA